MDDFAAMNEVYDEFFVAEQKPVGTLPSPSWEAILWLTSIVPDLRCCEAAAPEHGCRDRVHSVCELAASGGNE